MLEHLRVFLDIYFTDSDCFVTLSQKMIYFHLYSITFPQKMAIFSEGGTSYPDILVILYLVTCFIISSIVNPAVFIYNCRKRNSVAVFLFRFLAVFDFFTCIFIPIKVVLEAVGEECSADERNLQRSERCIERQRRVLDIPVRLYSLVACILIFTPNLIAATMAICRFIQIKFPFYPLKLKHVVISAVIFEIYTLVINGYVAFHSDSVYHVNKQLVVNILGLQNNKQFVPIIYVFPSVICQFISVFTSLLTIHHLWNVGREPIAEQSAISRKSSLKILVTNFGSIVSSIAMVSSMAFVFSGDYGYYITSVVQFFTVVLAPVLLSCFNPIVFIVFTPSFRLAQGTRPTAG